MRNFVQQPTPAPPQVEIPQEFPAIPKSVIERFPEAEDWQRRLNQFWTRTNQAIQQAQGQIARQVNANVVFNVESFLIYANGVPTPMFALDASGVRLGNVLTINTPGRKVYVGAGEYENDNTPFYIDQSGRFSLGSSLAWDPETDTLTVVGDINATTGTIGGFVIGADYIRDAANTFGLASTDGGGADVRFWAGAPFVSRGTAPVRIFDTGQTVITNLNSASVEIITDGSRTYGLDILGTTPILGSAAANILAAADTGPSANGQTVYGMFLFPKIVKGAFTGITAHGYNVRLNSVSGAGTIDNAFGVYIDTVNIATNNWGLYVATTAKNYMAGALQVASLAGVGTRNVVVDASGNLSAP